MKIPLPRPHRILSVSGVIRGNPGYSRECRDRPAGTAPQLCDWKYNIPASGCVTFEQRRDRITSYFPALAGERLFKRSRFHLKRGHMKRFAFFTGFLLLTTAMAVPFFLKRKVQPGQTPADDNIRYDIDDYMATEGL